MRVPLDSSLLAWVRYDALRHQLEVQFRSSQRYLFFQVPQACFHDLLEAQSKGAYFNHHIRNHFPYQHLSPSASPVVLAAPAKTK
jgi:hypothetical protein